MGRFVSLVIGAGSPLLLGLLGFILGGWCFDVSLPVWSDGLNEPSPGAWLWSPSTSTFTLAPYARARRTPSLYTAPDGTIKASKWSSSPGADFNERFDGKRFVEDEGSMRWMQPPPASPPESNGSARRIVRGTWLVASSEETARTWIRSGDEWKKGPTLPPRLEPRGNALDVGGRIFFLCAFPGEASNAPGLLCSARATDPAFRATPVGGLDSHVYDPLLLPYGDQQALVVDMTRAGEESSVVTARVDLDSGACSSGPPLSGQLARKGITYFSTATLPDGSALIAVAGPATDKGFDPPVGGLALLVLSLLALLVAEGWALRARLAIGWAMAGAVMGILVDVFCVSLLYSLKHLHI